MPAGGAHDLAKAKFKEDAKESGGVHLFCKFEQIEQMSDYGLQRLLDDVIEDCIAKDCSKKSSRRLKKEFQGPNKKLKLAKAIVESAGISDGIRPICSTSYTVEGDGPMVLSGHRVHQNAIS